MDHANPSRNAFALSSEGGDSLHRRQLLTAGLRSIGLAVAAALSLAHQGAAQRAYHGIAGGVYGAATGALLGFVGSSVPCSQTTAGSSCIAWAMASSATAFGVKGVTAGLDDFHRLDHRLRGSAIGFAAGSAVGIGIALAAQRIGVMDVLTVGAFGAAIGSAPAGAGVGLLAGSAVGIGIHLAGPGMSLPDFTGFALAGLAAGALVDWLLDTAGDSSSSPGVRFTLRAPI